MTVPIPPNPFEQFTPFLPTTYNIPEEEDRHKTYLVDRFSNFADVINDKKIGVYTQGVENFNGEKWFYESTQITRNAYETTMFVPALPNGPAGTIVITRNTVPQYPIGNVNPEFVIVRCWGAASRPCSSIGKGDGSYFQFNNAGDPRIGFTVSDTAIAIFTTTDLSAYQALITIEYLRNGL